MIVAQTEMPGGRRPSPRDPPHPETRRPRWGRRSTPDPPTPPPGGPTTPPLSSRWEDALALRRSRKGWFCNRRLCAAPFSVAPAFGRTPSRSRRWISVLGMLGPAMPWNSGPSRECSSKAARGVVVGWFW